MSYKALEFELAVPVATVTFNQEAVLNALTPELVADLGRVVPEIRRNPEIRAVIITGRGRAFCAGGSLKSIGEGFGPVEGYRYMSEGARWVQELATLPKPVVAAVNGIAVGAGLSIALACDVIVASEKATFGAVFGKVGLVPDVAMTYFLPRVVGLQRAKELVFSARVFPASEALEMGIALKVVPEEALMDEAMATARSFARGATAAMGMAKGLLNRSHATTLEEALEREAAAQALLFQTADHAEGVRAFHERRQPEFKGM